MPVRDDLCCNTTGQFYLLFLRKDGKQLGHAMFRRVSNEKLGTFSCPSGHNVVWGTMVSTTVEYEGSTLKLHPAHVSELCVERTLNEARQCSQDSPNQLVAFEELIAKPCSMCSCCEFCIPSPPALFARSEQHHPIHRSSYSLPQAGWKATITRRDNFQFRSCDCRWCSDQDKL